MINILRKSKKIPQRPIIHIFSNGMTEINYFKCQKNEIKRRCTQNRPNIKIERKCENGVKKIIEKIKRNYSPKDIRQNDRIFLVFDVDNDSNESLQEALDVKPEYINLILSNPDFELWLLLHFGYYNQQMAVGETLTILREHLPEYTKPIIAPIFPRLKVQEQTATSHSIQLRQQHIRDGNNLNLREANPHTFVDNVVDYLNSIN